VFYVFDQNRVYWIQGTFFSFRSIEVGLHRVLLYFHYLCHFSHYHPGARFPGCTRRQARWTQHSTHRISQHFPSHSAYQPSFLVGISFFHLGNWYSCPSRLHMSRSSCGTSVLSLEINQRWQTVVLLVQRELNFVSLFSTSSVSNFFIRFGWQSPSLCQDTGACTRNPRHDDFQSISFLICNFSCCTFYFPHHYDLDPLRLPDNFLTYDLVQRPSTTPRNIYE